MVALMFIRLISTNRYKKLLSYSEIIHFNSTVSIELVSKLSYGDKHTRKMDNGTDHQAFPLIAGDPSVEATQQPDSTLNAVASFVTPQLAPILLLGLFSIMGTDQVNVPFGQAIPQGIRAGRPIISQAWEPTTRSARSVARHRNLRQQRPNQGFNPFYESFETKFKRWLKK